MMKKLLAAFLSMTLILSVCSIASVSEQGINIGGNIDIKKGAGFIGYVSLSGDIVTIKSTLYGPISQLETAKFGISFDKSKVDMLKTDGTALTSYQNSDFMTDTATTAIASYSNIPDNFRKTLKVLMHSLPTVYYASVGFDKKQPENSSIDYNPASGSEFTATMKFKIKSGQAVTLSAVKSYFALTSEVLAPTLIVAGEKKFIPVSGNFADAYICPSIAHLDFTAIGADATPAPGNNVSVPSRTSPPNMFGTSLLEVDTFESGTPTGTISKPADGPNSIKVFGSSNKFVYFDYVLGTSAPSLRYNFSSPASGPFTIEFDYLPVDISPAPSPSQGTISLLIFGKGDNGNGAEEWFANLSISKSEIVNMATSAAGFSPVVFPTKNTPAQMTAGIPAVSYKVQILVKPEEQNYDVFVNGNKITEYPYEFRNKGTLTSSASSNYPVSNEIKFVGFQLATSSAAQTYKAGFDNIKAFGGSSGKFVGYASLSGDVVTITSKLYGPLTNLSTAKFGLTYDKSKVDLLKTDGTTLVTSYQNSEFMSDENVSGIASFFNVPADYRKTLKVLAHSLPTVYYASIGFDRIAGNQGKLYYNPVQGSEFTATLKFKIKSGQSADLASIKSYFGLSGNLSAPTLLITDNKKYIPVDANYADAYIAPAIAYIDYSSIGTDTIAAPASISNPVRTAAPASTGTTYLTNESFTSGISGATAAPGDTGNLSNIFTVKGADKYLYFDKTWPNPTPAGYSAANIKYNFSSAAQGPFTVEFDYYPVAESTGAMNVTVYGKDNNGTSAEKIYVNMAINKSLINNMGSSLGGSSSNIFPKNNTDEEMAAGTGSVKYKIQVYVKPDEQSYDLYVDGCKISNYSYETRQKGMLTSSISPDSPSVGEVRYTSFYISTSTAAGIYKAGFDNITSYGGMPVNIAPRASSYFVAPNGNDSNPGTEAAPFKTLEKARKVVGMYNSYMSGDITVYLAAGDYYMDATLTLNAKDSGTNGYKIIYKNKDALGSARLIGGKNLSGWTPVSGTSIYKVNVGTGLNIGTLYENEKFARVARYPNINPDKDYPSLLGDYLLSESGDADGTFIQYYPNTANAGSWTVTDTAKVVWWGFGGTPDWGFDSRKISSIDISQRKIIFETPCPNGTGKNDRFYVEGMYELLDAPGELYYNSEDGWLYYYPMDGNPNSSTILLPTLKDIIKIDGQTVGNHVKDISLEGLYFYGTMLDIGNGLTGAGLMLNHTKNINVLNCHFKNMGGHAVKMAGANEYNTVYGCWFEHTGLGAVWVYNLLNRNNYPDNKTHHIKISNCKMQDITELYCLATYNGGVMLSNTNNCEVSNCEIFNSSRYAISLRGHYSTEWEVYDNNTHYAKDNVFKYIKIYNCGTDSGDMGAMHAAHVNKTDETNINFWDQITIDNITAAPSMQDIKPNGIFLDHPHSCENQSISNIKITNTQGIPYRTNVNPLQNLKNVSFTGTFDESKMEYSSIGLKSDFPSAYSGKSTTATPAPKPSVMPYEIVIDNVDSGYSESGAVWVASNPGNTYGIGARYNNSLLANQWARWTPNIPNEGLYEVYVWKFAANSLAMPAARYTTTFSGGTAINYVNQTAISNRWEKLGTYYFAAGTGGYVTLNCNLTSYTEGTAVRADAVKFVPLLPNDASGYWSFNEASGTDVLNGRAGSPNGTLANGAVRNKNGKFGSSVILDGIDDYINIPDNDAIEMGTGDFAISIWFKRDENAAGNLRLLSKGAEYAADTGYSIFGSNTGITATISNGTTRIDSPGVSHLGVGVWNHLVVNYDRDGNMAIYINGVLANSTNISSFNGSNIINTRNLSIGKSNTGIFWDGEVDDVRIFTRVLTPADISTLYNSKY